jgi:hypothetical protein
MAQNSTSPSTLSACAELLVQTPTAPAHCFSRCSHRCPKKSGHLINLVFPLGDSWQLPPWQQPQLWPPLRHSCNFSDRFSSKTPMFTTNHARKMHGRCAVRRGHLRGTERTLFRQFPRRLEATGSYAFTFSLAGSRTPLSAGERSDPAPLPGAAGTERTAATPTPCRLPAPAAAAYGRHRQKHAAQYQPRGTTMRQ